MKYQERKVVIYLKLRRDKMAYTEQWKEIIKPMLDQMFQKYDPVRHTGLEFVFKDRITGSSSGPGVFPVPERLFTDEKRSIVHTAILNTLASRLSGVSPDNTDLELIWA
jgi:hypothetical protein